MPTLQERFEAIEANQQTTITELNEASTEILAELQALRGMQLPPEAEASLERIETRATGLAAQATTMADISPPVP